MGGLHTEKPKWFAPFHLLRQVAEELKTKALMIVGEIFVLNLSCSDYHINKCEFFHNSISELQLDFRYLSRCHLLIYHWQNKSQQKRSYQSANNGVDQRAF